MRKHSVHLLLLLLFLLITQSVIAQQTTQRTYTVKPGETLYSLSRQFNVSVQQLRQWNHLKGNAIKVGESLIVRPPEKATPAANNKPSGSQPSSFLNGNVSGTDFYTVKSGDNLYKIARQFNMTLNQLKQLNNLSSNVLRVGQRLRVRAQASAPSIANDDQKSTPQGRFTKYKVKRGENLAELLKRFQMDSTEFKALNPGLGTDLFRGEQITVLLPPTVHHANPYVINSTLKDVTLTPAVAYKSSEIGNPTTNGNLYNPDALTAASSSIPLGSVVYIMNPANGKGIYVQINDRVTKNEIKLSQKAYNDLGLNPAHSSVKILQNQ